ncbi:MAG TPA: D-aminoacyl-tRNA deacylase [Candidatus Cloacimonadota bacterium]|nr:D-aminoacyl-tRNA deacylase [Candidatus Cloacimonadota bacterium]
MRLVLQRVLHAKVEVEGKNVGQIGPGLLVLVGFTGTDTADLIPTAISKLTQLRIFADEAGKLNLSLLDTGGSLLVISQFTLYANCSRGRRPDFTHAAEPGKALELYNEFVRQCRLTGLPVETGIFAADMQVSLLNDGPITINLEY